MPQVIASVSAMPFAANIEVKIHDPDECVAKGAAIFAHDQSLMNKHEDLPDLLDEVTRVEDPVAGIDQLSADSRAKLDAIAEAEGVSTLSLVSQRVPELETVCSKSFGIVVFNRATQRELVANLVTINSEIPIEVERMFTSLGEGADVSIQIMENLIDTETAEFEYSREIGSGILDFGEVLPAESPIKVYFSLQRDGTLDVVAEDLTNHQTVDVTIVSENVISGERLEEAKARGARLSN